MQKSERKSRAPEKGTQTRKGGEKKKGKRTSKGGGEKKKKKGMPQSETKCSAEMLKGEEKNKQKGKGGDRRDLRKWEVYKSRKGVCEKER